MCQETPPNTVYDMTPVRDGSAVSAPIIGHAHGTADGRKLIRHYAREVAALLTKQETAAEESPESTPIAECERITSLSEGELAEEQRERAAVMVAEVADASDDLARRTAAEPAAEAAVSPAPAATPGSRRRRPVTTSSPPSSRRRWKRASRSRPCRSWTGGSPPPVGC